MQKNIWQQLVAVIIFIWALWNYEITLSLLGSALGILMPLITGCVIAFTVNVFIEKFEQIWMRVLKERAARFRGPVCLIAGFMLIFGVITALLFAVLPELHASIVILSHKLPQDIVYFNAFLHLVRYRPCHNLYLLHHTGSVYIIDCNSRTCNNIILVTLVPSGRVTFSNKNVIYALLTLKFIIFLIDFMYIHSRSSTIIKSIYAVVHQNI